MEDCTTDGPIQDITRLEIIGGLLNDLCDTVDTVSNLTQISTSLENNRSKPDGTTIPEVQHHCGNGTDAIAPKTEDNNNSILSCNNNASAVINHNNINNEFQHLREERRQRPAGVSKTTETLQQDSEYNSETQDIQPPCPEIADGSKTKNNNGNVIMEPTAATIPATETAHHLTDNMAKNNINVESHTEAKYCDPKEINGVAASTSLIEISPENSGSLANDLVNECDVAEQDLQFANRLPVVQNNRVNDTENSPSSPLSSSSSSSCSDSDTSSSSSESSSDESSSESITSLKNLTAKIYLDEDDEDDDEQAKLPPKTKDEVLLSELPPLAPVDIIVDDQLNIKPLGEIESILEETSLVIIKSFTNVPALDSESILFFEDRSFFGQVFDIFGQVKNPHYCVRFDSEDHDVENKFHVGQQVYYAPDTTKLTNFVFMSHVKSIKGSDASWQHDQEPPDTLIEFSDDEAEKEAKSKKKGKKQKKNRDRNNRYMNGQTNFQQPHSSCPQRHRADHRLPVHGPNFSPRPRFGFQPNQPPPNQYPPPTPEQPGDPYLPYNEYPYYHHPPQPPQGYGYSRYPTQPPPPPPPPPSSRHAPPYYQQLRRPVYPQRFPPPCHPQQFATRPPRTLGPQ